MAASDDTVRDIVNVLRRHVDEATLEKIINELLDVPGNKKRQRSRCRDCHRRTQRIP
jgi:hypothetical protein